MVRLEGDWPAVRERRAALGMSTAELARRTGLSPTTVRYIGGRPNRRWALYEIERVLRWPRGHLINVLTGGSPPPQAPSVAARLTRIERKVDEIASLVRNGSAPEP